MDLNNLLYLSHKQWLSEAVEAKRILKTLWQNIAYRVVGIFSNSNTVSKSIHFFSHYFTLFPTYWSSAADLSYVGKGKCIVNALG